MPVSLTYPGVYIEELSSGVHTITGVATSIAAFVGWAAQGPTNEAVLVQSWPAYQAQFGGLDSRSYLGYAVSQFFSNGGQQAYIVRLAWNSSLPAAPGTSPVPAATSRVVGIGLASAAITATLGGVSANANLTVGSAVLQSIAITPVTLPFLQAGQTLQLTATGTNSDTTTPNLTNTAVWKSGSPAVATVTANGLVTAVSAGTTIITATLGAVTASVVVTSSAAILTSIAVAPTGPSIALGQTQPFTAKGTYTDGTSQDLTGIVTWASSDTSKATIDPAGLANGVAAGTLSITATLGAVSGNTGLTVGATALVSITVTPANAPWIGPAKTQQFKATGTFTDGTISDLSATATWTSSNASVVTIDATGLATGVAAGSAVLTATLGGVPGSATLRITAATLASISVSPAAPSLAAGLTKQLAATGAYSDGTTQDLTDSVVWNSADTSKATVDPKGLLKGVAAGATSVTATLSPATPGNTAVTVTPAVLTSIAVTPGNNAVASGGSQQFTAMGTLSDGTTSNMTNTVTWGSSNPAVATVNAAGLATAVAAGGTLTLFAANPGLWGNSIQVGVTVPAGNPGRFSLQIQYKGQVVENFTNLSTTTTDPQYVVTVIQNDSQYVSFTDPATNLPVLPTGAPTATGAAAILIGGADGTPLVPASDMNFEAALMDTSAGLSLLDRVEIFNILCVPGETDAPTISTLQGYCSDKRAFYVVDSPQTATVKILSSGPAGTGSGSLTGQYSKNSAYYFPWVQAPDPLFGNRPSLYPPCGFVAGIYAATDSSRGVWKAPAGIDASLTGVSGLQYTLTDAENGSLNPHAVNCLREFKVYGDVVWGARTLQGDDQAGSEWKYVPIRRLALYLESSLYNGTKWVVFEPNDERLWGQIRLNVGAFMQGLFLQGAFQGLSAQKAYFVKCDGENNPQPSIDLGIVNILVGFAPLYPAEFVVIQIQQLAGQLQA